MNILIISYTYPPNKDGVSEAASTLGEGLSSRGWDVEVLTAAVSPGRTESLMKGVRIFEYVEHGDPDRFIHILNYDGDYERFLSSGNWQVIVFEAYHPLLYKALPFLDRISAAKVLASHGFGALQWARHPRFPYGLGQLIRRSLRSLKMPFWIRRLDRVVYLSEHRDLGGFYDHWLAYRTGYKGRRVIPNGVDPDLRGQNPGEFRERNQIPPNAPLFVCVANYSHRKDQGFAARAFRRAAIPGSVLVFIGSEFNSESGRFQAEDDQFVQSSHPGRIVWLEKQSREHTLDAVAACDALLLSAYHEAQPIVLLEAMREGKPWIARKAGCISIMEGGICVRTVRQMSRAMIHLTDNPGLGMKLGEEGMRAVATRYNRNKYIDSYATMLNGLIHPVPPASL